MREPSTGKLSGGGHPVGESQNQPFQLSFNRFLRVDFQGSRVTSDGGLLVVRELDERLGLTGLIQNHLVDSRTGRNTQFPLADLFRQSAYSRLAGYEDSNDATRVSADPSALAFMRRRRRLGSRPSNRSGRRCATTAAGIRLRHDHGSQYMSDDFQAEVAFLGMESSPAFVRQPSSHGSAGDEVTGVPQRGSPANSLHTGPQHFPFMQKKCT